MGCAAAKYQDLRVSSRPAGAEIYLDGERVGQTPMRLRVGRDDHHKLFLKKDGYRPELYVLRLRRAADGIDYLTPADIDAPLVPGRRAGQPEQSADGTEPPGEFELQRERRLEIRLEPEEAERRE